MQLHFEEAGSSDAPLQDALPNQLIDMTGRKILLCEDNSLNSEIAVALLKDKGMSVTVAENVKVGLDEFSNSEEGEYDAVLMDIRMPVMDGIEAAEAIRSLDRPDAGTVPIIAMSADAFADDILRCENAGMNGHIAKPVNPDILYQTLSKAMSDSRK